MVTLLLLTQILLHLRHVGGMHGDRVQVNLASLGAMITASIGSSSTVIAHAHAHGHVHTGAGQRTSNWDGTVELLAGSGLLVTVVTELGMAVLAAGRGDLGVELGLDVGGQTGKPLSVSLNGHGGE